MKINEDIGHKISDYELEKLERKLKKLYDECYKETKQQFDRIEAILSEYKDSMTDKERERLWRKKGRLNSMLDALTDDIRQTNVTATNMINDHRLNIYEINYNYGAYFMEVEGGYKLDFRLYNQEIFKELLKDNVNPFNKIALDHIKDKKLIYKSLKNSFLQSIRLGESINEIAARIKKIVGKNNYDSVRIARTETTRLESIGREEAFKKGEEAGLKLKKVWISTIDSRTRDAHLLLNGVAINMDETFENGLKYPGDFNSAASEVINCRCSHVVEIQGVKKSANLEKLDDDLQEQTLQEWLRRKENGNR